MKSWATTTGMAVVAAGVLLVGGCNRHQAAAVNVAIGDIGNELIRQVDLECNGPVVVASVVGFGAPPCGPAGLSPLCADRAWRLWSNSLMRNSLADPPPPVPSPLEPLDPNRPAKVGQLGVRPPVRP